MECHIDNVEFQKVQQVLYNGYNINSNLTIIRTDK